MCIPRLLPYKFAVEVYISRLEITAPIAVDLRYGDNFYQS